MIKNTLACLQGAMNYAILPLKYIQTNPCAPVKIGKIPIDVDAKEHSEYVLPKEEYERILDRFPASNYFNISLVLPYNMGTRIGETFAINQKLNVEYCRHDYWHTHGTILAENGVNPKTVMERLGHKNIETTLQTYTFNTEVMQQTAVDIFEKAMNA